VVIVFPEKICSHYNDDRPSCGKPADAPGSITPRIVGPAVAAVANAIAVAVPVDAIGNTVTIAVAIVRPMRTMRPPAVIGDSHTTGESSGCND
jgi:hypothetical protein